METRRSPGAREGLEADVRAIVDILDRHGLGESQPEQVAGRWVQAGFEDPAEIEHMIGEGIKSPEQAAEVRRGIDFPAGARHTEETEPRDVARGTTHSRTEPGDEVER